jgi:N utilization substance protein B
MASNRHLGRIIVLQTLYEEEFRRECGDKSFTIGKVINRNISRYRANVEDKDFITELAGGVSKQSKQLDERLQPIAPDWPLNQIAKIDHIVLKIGAYELINHSDVPPKVVINEAVELAKGFGGDNSSKFINGVLGTLLRDVQPDSKVAAKKKPAAKKAPKKKTKTAKSKK